MKGYPVDTEELERLHGQGLSATQIAEQVGCTTRTVFRWRSLSGVARERAPIVASPETLQRARELFDDGASQQEVHRTTGIGQHTLSRHFPGRGWSASEAGRHAVVAKALLHLRPVLP